MAIQLVVADQTFEVEQLTDTPVDWQGLKVMLTQPDVVLNVASGVEVTIQGDQALAGSYRVAQVLSPAAPRTWRLFLEKPEALSSSQSPADPAATPVVASRPSRPDVPNRDKMFVIKVSGLVGSRLISDVRKSVVEYKVPFSRLSQEMARITKTGVKVLSVEEADVLGSL